MKNIVAFWGYPDPEVLQNEIAKNPNCEIVDLDVDYGYPSSGVMCEAYCKIIANIMNNAIFLRDKIKVVVASIGKEKCDSGHIAAILLKDMGFNIIQTKYEIYSHI